MSDAPSVRPPESNLPPLLTIEEVATLSRRSKRSVLDAIRAGDLRASTRVRPYLVPVTAVADWLGLELDDLRSRCSALDAVIGAAS